MIIVFIAMIGIKALFFGNKNSDKESNTKQQLTDLNEELNNLYTCLSEEQDSFASKRQSYERGIEAITSKKNEVDNRVDHLNGVKAKIGEQLALPSVDMKEFKELCEQYVSVFKGVEEAQTEVHSLEVELETSYAHWDDECKANEENVQRVQNDIQSILAKIAKIAKITRSSEKKK
jgi:chromosome segregation ATPase